LGKKSSLLTPHQVYLDLGQTEQQRFENYRSSFKTMIDHKLIDTIRKSTNTGLALGNSKFISEIEKLTGKKVTAKKAGRPKKSKLKVD
jgi:putative transposase